MTDQGQALSTENKTASQVDSAVSGLESVAEQAIDKAAETSQPFLAVPVIKQIFESIVHFILSLESRVGQLVFTFGITRGQGSAENSSLVDAEKEVETAIQTGDANGIAKAEADFQKAQSAAANSDGSATPK